MAGLCLLGVPGPGALRAQEIYFTETFATAPAANGWQSYGDSSLFTWNSARQAMDVTWNSARPNSLFCRPLGIVLNKTNDFLLGFDLVISNVAIGTTPDKPYTFELAVGLTDLASATNVDFQRGTGFTSPNLVEFDYFPDSGYGATVAGTIISSVNEWSSGGFTYPFAVSTGDVYHVELRYAPSRRTLYSMITRNGARCAPLQEAKLGEYFSDFRVDHIAISSYSDAGQDPAFAGSITAQGTVDNFLFISPTPVGEVTGGFNGAVWQMQFLSHTSWMYRLERTQDLQTWTEVTTPVPGTGAPLMLADDSPPAGKAFYHVRATRQ